MIDKFFLMLFLTNKNKIFFNIKNDIKDNRYNYLIKQNIKNNEFIKLKYFFSK